MINRLDPMAGSHRALGRRLGVAGADADRAAGGTACRSVHRPAAALVLAVLLWCCVLETQQTMDLDEADAGSAGWGAGEGESLRRQAGGANGRAYKGYDGYWLFDEEEATVHGGLGDADVVSKLYDKVSPCRYDGRICTRSKRVLSNPGEFVHDTGRQYCVKRTTVEDCDVRMRARGFAQRLDQYRPKPLELYPAVDGHTTTTFVAGTNFHGELGLGVRIAIQRPTIQTYFKLGDGLYEQAMGAGRGFKNLSLVSMGFAHSLGMDEQGVFYAWGANDFGQLGITSRRYPTGHRYTMLWPQPLPFFRPWRVKLCEGGLNNLRFCESTMLVPSFEFVPPTGQCALANQPGSSECVRGFNQVSRRRNAFGTSKQPGRAAHSAAITDLYKLGADGGPEACFNYRDFLDESATLDGTAGCEGGGKLYTWGYNIKGQLGHGSTAVYVQQPVAVLNPKGHAWYHVALGGHRSAVLPLCIYIYICMYIYIYICIYR